jgi:enolase
MRIKAVTARQIINSKGHPTLQIEVSTSKNTAVSSVPIAASKSKYEFFDAYDNNLKRFHGETLDIIVENVNRVIAPEFVGRNAMDQEAVDQLLLDIDSTLERTRLGVNTITATSQAVAKLGAMESDLPLFKYLRVLHDFTGSPTSKLNSEYSMPTPILTIYNGGAHAEEKRLPAQEIVVLPKGKFVYNRDLVNLYQSLSQLNLVDSRHTLKTFLDHVTKQLSKSSFKFNLGMDFSASKYKRIDQDEYVIPHYNSTKVPFVVDFHRLAKAYLDLVKQNKLVYLEDFFNEDDYSAWKEFKDKVHQLDDEIQVVSDDFTATNLERLEKVGLLESANNVVIKPSQTGTVTECIHFAQRARKYGMNVTVSYRHGETEDTFISDLAVGINAEYIRTGYFKGSEHTSKLNRLLQIEDGVK